MTREEIEDALRELDCQPVGSVMEVIDFALQMCARQAEEDAKISWSKASKCCYTSEIIADAIRANAPKVDK